MIFHGLAVLAELQQPTKQRYCHASRSFCNKWCKLGRSGVGTLGDMSRTKSFLKTDPKATDKKSLHIRRLMSQLSLVPLFHVNG